MTFRTRLPTGVLAGYCDTREPSHLTLWTHVLFVRGQERPEWGKYGALAQGVLSQG